jgi:hypothetical protein
LNIRRELRIAAQATAIKNSDAQVIYASAIGTPFGTVLQPIAQPTIRCVRLSTNSTR